MIMGVEGVVKALEDPTQIHHGDHVNKFRSPVEFDLVPDTLSRTNEEIISVEDLDLSGSLSEWFLCHCEGDVKILKQNHNANSDTNKQLCYIQLL
eukprot:11570012-Ditylum_brightwellii.AAC.1